MLRTFEDKHGSPPEEFFIHGRTTFNNEEWGAFTKAAPVGTNMVAVRIRPTTGDVKLFRDGDYPAIRGTAILIDERNAYLWTNGFIPSLNTYIGPETPNPLFITVLRSTGKAPDIKTVLKDIMGLTKINYNACKYNDSLPVTVRFADKVGEILTMGSARDSEKTTLEILRVKLSITPPRNANKTALRSYQPPDENSRACPRAEEQTLRKYTQDRLSSNRTAEETTEQ